MQDYQRFILLEEYIELPFATIIYEPTDGSFYENNALINTTLTKAQLLQIENEFAKLKRTPAIYFEDNSTLRGNITFLQNGGYTQEWRDSWMFYESVLENNDNFRNIKIVKTEEDLQVFLETFNACYQKNDPQNPYGEVTDYLKGSKNRWMKHHTSKVIQYFIAFDKDEPVAVAALTSLKGLGYISAVGSLQKVRGGGFGKQISLFAVYISQQMGNKHHFLLTEVGGYPHKFYQHIGFREKFKGIGLYK